MTTNIKQPKIALPWAAVGFMVALNLAAVIDWPYGFYQFLRLANTGYAIYLAYQLFQHRPGNLAWSFCAMAVLFNPILPIWLERETWMIIDITAAIYIAATSVTIKRT